MLRSGMTLTAAPGLPLVVGVFWALGRMSRP